MVQINVVIKMKDFIIIKDPEVAKLLADESRRVILHNLRHFEMTPCQLAKILNKSVSSVMHHLNLLEKAGLVEQTRSVVKGNLVERYYRATAKIFIISYTLSEGLVPGSEDIAQWSREICKGAVEGLEAFGFKLSEEKAKEILGLVERYSHLEQAAREEVISQWASPLSVDRQSLKLLLSLLTDLRLYRSREFLEVLDRIWEILEG